LSHFFIIADIFIISGLVPKIVINFNFFIFLFPYILINDNDTLQVGNLELQFIHTPGHTVGGMCIYVKSENVLFSGDTLFQQSVGRTDFPGGSFEQIVNSIRNRLFVLPEETKVFPGHMGPTNIGFEKRSNPFV
jgi:glyoxylase-like metal-dependent hydrolase (beta-lactamase superfamily II)